MWGKFAAVAAAATLPTAGLLIAAGPAAAEGCEVNMLGAQYCDGPIQADGTWKRCWTVQASYYPTFGGAPGFGVSPAAGNCYQVDPAVPWPVVPIGQPQYYINADRAG